MQWEAWQRSSEAQGRAAGVALGSSLPGVGRVLSVRFAKESLSSFGAHTIGLRPPRPGTALRPLGSDHSVLWQVLASFNPAHKRSSLRSLRPCLECTG